MPPVKLILHLPQDEPLSAELSAEIEKRLNNVLILRAGSLEEFGGMLRPGDDSGILAVLSMEDEMDVTVLKEMSGLLQRIDLILVVSGGKDQLKNQARRIRPRYILTWPEESFDLPLLVEAVVGKIQRLAGAGAKK